MENWRPVVGYEGIYKVSDLGNVMALSYGNIGGERVLKPGMRNGYHKVDLYRDRIKTSFNVHRIAS